MDCTTEALSPRGYGTVESRSAPPDWKARSISEEARDTEGSSSAHGEECVESCISGKSACKVAMAHIVAEKNDYIRHGGFSPSQWVLGRKPRAVANLLDEDEFADLGAIAASMDSATAFGYQTAPSGMRLVKHWYTRTVTVE